MAHGYDNEPARGNLRLPSCGQPKQVGIGVQEGLQRASLIANAHLIVEVRRRASSHHYVDGVMGILAVISVRTETSAKGDFR